MALTFVGTLTANRYGGDTMAQPTASMQLFTALDRCVNLLDAMVQNGIIPRSSPELIDAVAALERADRELRARGATG